MTDPKDLKYKRFSKWLGFFVGPSILFFYLLPILANSRRLGYEGGDVYHNIWTWKRNFAYLNSFNHIYLSQILYPDQQTSFWGEVELGDTLLFHFLNLFTKNDLSSYSLLLFLGSCFTYILIYKILLLVNVKEIVAIICGLLITVFSYRWPHIAHIQLLSLYWLFLPVYFFLKNQQKLGLSKKIYTALLLGSTFILFAGPSNQVTILILFSSVFFVYSVFLKIYLKELREYLKGLSTQLIRYRASLIPVACGILMGGFFWIPYLKLAAQGFIRGSGDQWYYRLDLASLLGVSPKNWFYGSHQISQAGNESLYQINFMFPGFAAMVCLFLAMQRFGTLDLKMKIAFYSFLSIFIATFSNPITYHQNALLNNPFYIVLSKTRLLVGTRYLPQLSYLCMVGITLVLALGFQNKESKKNLNRRLIAGWSIPFVLIFSISVENYPSPQLIVPATGDPETNWQPVLQKIIESKPDVTVIFPGPTNDPSESPVFIMRQFEWMAGLAAAPTHFIGGRSGYAPLDRSNELMQLDGISSDPIQNFGDKIKSGRYLLILDNILLSRVGKANLVEKYIAEAKLRELKVKETGPFTEIQSPS